MALIDRLKLTLVPSFECPEFDPPPPSLPKIATNGNAKVTTILSIKKSVISYLLDCA